MTNSDALHRLRAMQVENEQTLTIAQRDALQRRDDAATRLHELERYLAEYRASFTESIARGRIARDAQDHLAFTARLDAAVGLQRARLLACERDYEQALTRRSTMVRARRTTEKLLARRLAVTAANEVRREVREIEDRLAARGVRADV
ncbi:MAG: hypothetical protein EBZ40_10105 [Gammaproteobacteria bacterium]|nr:hypothetical protein [Gammaproteobacteria bacterium]